MNELFLVNAIVTAVRHDMSQGGRKDDILKGLSRVISRDLFVKVREQL